MQNQNDYKDWLQKAKYLKKIIETLIEKGDIDTAEAKILEYKNLAPQDIEIKSIETILCIMKNQLNQAEQTAKEGLENCPFNFDLNYNLSYAQIALGKPQEAVEALINAKAVAKSEDEIKIIEDSIKGLKKTETNLDWSQETQLNYKLFPLKNTSQTYIGHPLFVKDGLEGYIPLYYNEAIQEYPVQLWNCFKTETLNAKITKDLCEFENLDNHTIPVAVTESADLILTTNQKEYKFTDFIPNRYYYLPVKSAEKITIKSLAKVIVGQPIALKQEKSHQAKLVLNIFVDGLSQEIIDQHTLEKLMPNTHNFFKKGSIFTNCYSNAEWTLASVPTMFTGRYQTNTHIYHPELLHTIDDQESMGTAFQKDGYLTFQACGNWRKNPAYGYTKGMDRMIYQSATVGSKAEDIIASFLEQQRAFEERDQFAWLSFFELHNVDDNKAPIISNQIRNSLDSRIIANDNKKSVAKSYDNKKIERYINEINRLDYYLKTLFDFVESKYPKDQFIVSLVSDHGQSYISEDQSLLGHSRIKVPFMVRGIGIPQQTTEDLMENIDLLPILLDKANIKYEENQFDGKTPIALGGKHPKEYVYSESIYPGKTYKANLEDKEHTFSFESEYPVQEDGRFDLGIYKIRLINKETNEDQTETHQEKTDRYFITVIDHISSYLKI